MLFQTIAHNDKNEEILADDAVRGTSFFCPSCKGPMILRRGKINIPHFAHKNLTPNCKPETVLHMLGKEEVKKIAEDHLARRSQMEAKFHCSNCGTSHNKNILENIQSVQLEKALEFARPDVSFVRDDGTTSVAIEIVVTHKPEPEVLELFERKDVFYIRINLKEFLDLKDIESKIRSPFWDRKEKYSRDRFCTIKDNPELFCSKHGWAKDQRRLFVIEYPCNKCNKYTKVAVLNLDNENPFNRQLPDTFTEKEIQIARKEGVLLDKHKFSNHQHGYYWLVNKCSHCSSLPYYTGSRKSDTQYEYGGWYEKHPEKAKIFETGYSCEECEWEELDSD